MKRWFEFTVTVEAESILEATEAQVAVSDALDDQVSSFHLSTVVDTDVPDWAQGESAEVVHLDFPDSSA